MTGDQPADATAPANNDRVRWRVGFYVEVEVDAYDGEAALVAEAACQWPGSWRPPLEPTTTTGVINDRPVTARIISSLALMARRVTP